jgi:hypothetical protein
MKKILFLVIIFNTLYSSVFSQNAHLIPSDTTINPLYTKDNIFRQDTIKFKLHVDGNTADLTELTFSLDASGIPSSNKPVLPSYLGTIKLSSERWHLAVSTTNTIDTFLLIQIPGTTDTLKHDQIARLYIVGKPESYVQIRLTSVLPPVIPGKIILDNSSAQRIYISPFTDNANAPKEDTIKIKLKFTGNYNPENVVHLYIDTPALANDLRIRNPIIRVNKAAWDSGELNASIFLTSNSVFDTGNLKSAYCLLKIKEDTLDAIPIWMTYRGNLWYKKSNFFIGSFIKSIAGTTAQSELLDIFLKINLLPQEKLQSGHLLFSMIGADAGLSSDTIGKNGLPLNEAMVSINWVPTFITGKIDDYTKRIGFIGGGLKVFYANAYFGAHIGVTEISSFLKGSYLLAGFYHSPWISKITDSTNTDINRLPHTYYRDNIYFEAAFNAFGDNAPKALQFIRLKFGLMLPVKSKDAFAPTKNDFIYRLAVEVPIGGPLKF